MKHREREGSYKMKEDFLLGVQIDHIPPFHANHIPIQGYMYKCILTWRHFRGQLESSSGHFSTPQEFNQRFETI